VRITTAVGAGFRVSLALPAGAPTFAAARQGERDGVADGDRGRTAGPAAAAAFADGSEVVASRAGSQSLREMVR